MRIDEPHIRQYGNAILPFWGLTDALPGGARGPLLIMSDVVAQARKRCARPRLVRNTFIASDTGGSMSNSPKRCRKPSQWQAR